MRLAAFWGTYGDLIAILPCGIVGAFATVFVDYLKSRKGTQIETHSGDLYV